MSDHRCSVAQLEAQQSSTAAVEGRLKQKVDNYESLCKEKDDLIKSIQEKVVLHDWYVYKYMQKMHLCMYAFMYVFMCMYCMYVCLYVYNVYV